MRRWVGVVLGVVGTVLLGCFGLLLWLHPLGADSSSARQFQHYFQNSPRQVRGLQAKGNDWQETHLVMTFELTEPLRYKPTPELKHLEGPQLASRFAADECASFILEKSRVLLDYKVSHATYGKLPGSSGRLIVQNDSKYCVFIWAY